MNFKAVLGAAVAIVIFLAAVDGAGRHLPQAQGSTGVTGALSGLTADQVTQESWADALLETLGKPSTMSNLQAIVAWENQESGVPNADTGWIPVARPTFNPLNATQPEPGSHTLPGNSDGVQAYTSWDYGLQATVDTLRAGNHGYPAILAALDVANDAGAVCRAVVRSDWGTRACSP